MADTVGEAVTTGSITLADLPVIRTAMADYRPALVIIDPLLAYLGAKIDMYHANEVRPIFAALVLLAEQFDCAIVCVRHLSKATYSRAIFRSRPVVGMTDSLRQLTLAPAP